jgi:hypothetical protein
MSTSVDLLALDGLRNAIYLAGDDVDEQVIQVLDSQIESSPLRSALHNNSIVSYGQYLASCFEFIDQYRPVYKIDKVSDDGKYRFSSVAGLIIKDANAVFACIGRDPIATCAALITLASRGELNLGRLRRDLTLPSGLLIAVARCQIALGDGSRIGQIAIEASDRFNTITGSLIKKIDSYDEEIDRLKNVYANFLKLDSTHKYFVKKSRSHKYSAIWSFILFCIIIMIIIFIVVANLSQLNDILNRIKSDNSIVYVFLLSVLFGSVAWVLRLISRFYVHNMMLWSDADQRAAMVTAYLALQSEGGIRQDEKERILILNAIFRPLSESKDEDLAPPSLLDFVKKS